MSEAKQAEHKGTGIFMMPRDFYDLAFTAAVGGTTLWVYLHLRRYVWRGGTRREDFQPKESQVVTFANQSAIGGAVGINRQNTSIHIAKLEKLGWINRLNTNGDKTERVYELGFRSKRGSEIFFADQCVEACRKSIGTGLKGMQAEERAEAVRDLLGATLVSPTRQALSRHQDKACLDSKTSLVSPARHHKKQAGRNNLKRQSGTAARASAGASAAHSLRSRATASPTKSRARDAHDRTTARTTPPPPVARGPLLPKSKTKKAKMDTKARLALLEALKVKTAQKTNSEVAKNTKKQQEKRARENLKGEPGGKGAPIRKLYEVWRALLHDKWPDMPEVGIAQWWTSTTRADGTIERRAMKEAGQCSTLVKQFDAPTVELLFRYSIANWEKIRERFKKSPTIPSVGYLMGLASSLVPEALMEGKSSSVQAEVTAWCEAHPGVTPPDEMLKRLRGEPVGEG